MIIRLVFASLLSFMSHSIAAELDQTMPSKPNITEKYEEQFAKLAQDYFNIDYIWDDEPFDIVSNPTLDLFKKRAAYHFQFKYIVDKLIALSSFCSPSYSAVDGLKHFFEKIQQSWIHLAYASGPDSGLHQSIFEAFNAITLCCYLQDVVYGRINPWDRSCYENWHDAFSHFSAEDKKGYEKWIKSTSEHLQKFYKTSPFIVDTIRMSIKQIKSFLNKRHLEELTPEDLFNLNVSKICLRKLAVHFPEIVNDYSFPPEIDRVCLGEQTYSWGLELSRKFGLGLSYRDIHSLKLSGHNPQSYLDHETYICLYEQFLTTINPKNSGFYETICWEDFKRLRDNIPETKENTIIEHIKNSENNLRAVGYSVICIENSCSPEDRLRSAGYNIIAIDTELSLLRNDLEHLQKLKTFDQIEPELYFTNLSRIAPNIMTLFKPHGEKIIDLMLLSKDLGMIMQKSMLDMISQLKIQKTRVDQKIAEYEVTRKDRKSSRTIKIGALEVKKQAIDDLQESENFVHKVSDICVRHLQLFYPELEGVEIGIDKSEDQIRKIFIDKYEGNAIKHQKKKKKNARKKKAKKASIDAMSSSSIAQDESNTSSISSTQTQSHEEPQQEPVIAAPSLINDGPVSHVDTDRRELEETVQTQNSDISKFISDYKSKIEERRESIRRMRDEKKLKRKDSLQELISRDKPKLVRSLSLRTIKNKAEENIPQPSIETKVDKIKFKSKKLGKIFETIKENYPEIIKEIMENPWSTEGLGQPELLKGDLKGNFSRRLDEKNRIVYKAKRKNGEVILKIFRLEGHY